MPLTLQDLTKRQHQRSDTLLTFPVTAGSAYSSGQNISTPQQIVSDGFNGPNQEPDLSCVIASLSLLDPSQQSAQIDVFFFNQALTGTYTDKTTFAPTLADMKNCLGVVPIAAADYANAGANMSIAGGKNQANLVRVLKPSGGTSTSTGIWVILVCRGTPTYVSTTSANLFLRVQQTNGL